MNRETTVLEFFSALEAGHEPKNYSYYKEDVPIGNYKAKLDFMLWSKTYVAINCFFTVLESQKKISLSVYKKAGEDGLFLAGELEVRYVPFDSVLQLNIEANQNGKPILVNAVVEGNVTSD